MNLIIGLALALLASVSVNLYQWRGHAVEIERIHGEQNTAVAAAEAAAQKSARAVESAQARAANEIAAAYEKGKVDAQAATDRLVIDLRDGVVSMRDRWQGCAAGRMSDAAATAGELDAARRDREESASRIVLAATRADRQIAGLQAWARDVVARYGAEAVH